MTTETASPVLQTFPLGAQWPTIDPFLFVAHHDDHYPAGTDDLGPDPRQLEGRAIGNDFSQRDGWSMYHGSRVPGFPQHPHRGFETITHVRHGYIDHADSMGATARFGHGDTQWMTAGGGVQHCEMFPLVDRDGDNPLELFQIWLNLPAADKMVEPYFTMLWNEQTPKVRHTDSAGVVTEVTVIAGALGETAAPTPPPNSWATHEEGDVAVWHIRIEAGGTWTMPRAGGDGTIRVLYAFEGSTLQIDDTTPLAAGNGAAVIADRDLVLRAGDGPVEIMLLQGRPIGEPVAQHGPFVMNTRDELVQAFDDYQASQFGGWPWDTPDPNHGAAAGRFAIHADGRRETPSPEAG